jgi:2-keto-4-pentenoate hydratase
VRAAEVMGDPVDALAWIAGALGAGGVSLRAGDV